MRERDQGERIRLVQKALKARLKELKLEIKTEEKASEDEEEDSVELVEENGDEHDPEWIYHDGTHHYSCSGLEEEGH